MDGSHGQARQVERDIYGSAILVAVCLEHLTNRNLVCHRHHVDQHMVVQGMHREVSGME